MQLSAIQWVLIIIGILILIWFIWWLVSKNQSPTTSNVESYTVQKSVSDKDFQLYYFYHPSCGHCKQFMPTWENFAKNYNGTGKIHTIDATKSENENLRFYYNVNKYPTIILSTQNKNVEYNGNRTIEDLAKFVDSHR